MDELGWVVVAVALALGAVYGSEFAGRAWGAASLAEAVGAVAR